MGFSSCAAMRIWCDYCGWNVRADENCGTISCSFCGKILADGSFVEEAIFVKAATGQAQMAGNIVKSIQADSSESQRRAHDEAYYGIKSKMRARRNDGGDDISGRGLHISERAGCAMLMWCSYCTMNVQTVTNCGRKSCSFCGKVLADDTFMEGTAFVKTTNGQADISIDTDENDDEDEEEEDEDEGEDEDEYI